MTQKIPITRSGLYCSFKNQIQDLHCIKQCFKTRSKHRDWTQDLTRYSRLDLDMSAPWDLNFHPRVRHWSF